MAEGGGLGYCCGAKHSLTFTSVKRNFNYAFRDNGANTLPQSDAPSNMPPALQAGISKKYKFLNKKDPNIYSTSAWQAAVIQFSI